MLPWILTIAFAYCTRLCAGHEGGPITCECTTAHCVERKTSTCTTEEGFCFTQYLDRGPGAKGPPLVRGCTESRTPILCENRRPSKARNWPLLHCCDADFCNRDAVPVPTDLTSNKHNIDIEILTSNATTDVLEAPQAIQKPPSFPHMSSEGHRSHWPHILSPVYATVLILGVVSLVFIGIVASILIRRSNEFYSDQYAALEFQPRKVRVTRCGCDPEVDSMGLTQPHQHTMYANRDT